VWGPAPTENAMKPAKHFRGKKGLTGGKTAVRAFAGTIERFRGRLWMHKVRGDREPVPNDCFVPVKFGGELGS